MSKNNGINSDLIKAAVASYWRFERGCTMVTIEADYGSADVMVLTKERYLMEIEVKVSLSDLRADKKKSKHQVYSRQLRRGLPICYFYFAVPRDLGVKAALICDQRYPYAGVIGTDGEPNTAGMLGHDIGFYRKARLVLPEIRKASIKDIRTLIKDQSGTVCRLASKVALK